MSLRLLRTVAVALLCIEIFCQQEVLAASIQNISRYYNLEDDCENRIELPFGEETLHNVGGCEQGGSLIEIRNQRLNTVYQTICHVENRAETLWTQHTIFGPLLLNPENTPRPSCWKKGNAFFLNMGITSWYTKEAQKQTLTVLLDSEDLAKKYITGTRFLAKGHLSAFADHQTADKKRATFYYLNATPQWQSINNGNWGKLETEIRNKAKRTLSTYEIYTGTHGVTTLRNELGNPVEIWLGLPSGTITRKLPVNHLSWKIIHDEFRHQAVAVIMVNNPYAVITPADIVCVDVCNWVPWVNWDRGDVTAGYTYCCTVESFRRSVPHAPNLGDLPLLT